MNRVVLVCAALALLVFGGLLLLKKNETRVVPYYVPGAASNLLASPAPTIPHFEPPSVDQIKKDLGGKTVSISGKSHQFVGPEINTVLVQKVTPVDSDNIAVDVSVCADATIVQQRGLLGARRQYTHENVCGTLRVYYERKDNQWVYRMAEGVDLQKMLTPNAKAPPTPSNVYRYQK